MSKPTDLSDETIEKLADALSRKIAPLKVPTYIDLTYRPWVPPVQYYPYVTSSPNSGSVSGSSYGSQIYNG